MRIHDDWDALGMRASGSNSVTFSDVEVPLSALRGGFLAGDAGAYMDRNLVAGLFHASASLGIAEAAAATSSAAVREPDARARTLVAENAIELGACRATLARAAALVDESDEPLVELFAEAQAAKTFVNEAAARIVDRALALSGGAGYLNGHPLARAYRDVRAGELHAAARRQPRLRPARRRRARPRARAALMSAAPALLAELLRGPRACATRSAASRPASRSSPPRSAARRSG